MTFASENDIRNEAFLDDFVAVPPERLKESLAKAHREILSGTTLTENATVTPEIVRAEAILALSHCFRSLAVSAAFAAKDVRIAGTRIDGPARVRHLMQISEELWEEAWSLLRPHLKTAAGPTLLLVEGESSAPAI